MHSITKFSHNNRVLVVILIIIVSTFLMFSCEITKTDDENKLPEYEQSGTIDDGGGIVKITDPGNELNGTTITIPENAIGDETEISINQGTFTDSLQVPMIDSTAVIVDFQPSGCQFLEPVQIGIPYSSDIDLETIQIYSFDEAEEKWVANPVDSVDTENMIAYTKITHFSYHATGDYSEFCDFEMYRIGSNRLALKVQTPKIENIEASWENELQGLFNMEQVLEYNTINDFFIWYKIWIKEDTWLFPEEFQSDWYYFSGYFTYTDMFRPKIVMKDEGEIWQDSDTYYYFSETAKQFFRGDAFIFISEPLPTDNDYKIEIEHVYSRSNNPANAAETYIRWSGVYSWCVRDINFSDLEEVPTSLDYDQDGITNLFDPYCEPEVTIDTQTGVQSGDITINYTVSDDDGSDNTFAIYYQASSVGTNQATLNYTSEGTIYNSNLIQNVSPGNHYFIWDSDQDYPNNHCTDMTIRISWLKDEGGSQLVATSNQFEVDNNPKYITVTSPNGGENWQMGSSHSITWDDNISENVKIELYKSGSYYETINNSTSSDGTYNWSIPTDLAESSNYKVKIKSTSNGSINDYSDNNFTIEEEPPADYITVTSPNGGENWQMGSSHNITWDDNISENVKIELYKSGSFYETIKSSTSSDGSYNWSIPTDLAESSNYKVKIKSTSNGSVNDYSDNNFTIEEEPAADYITVTSPNGGENWQMGSSYNITWDDNISENVKIELYKSDSYYETIESSTSSDGSYSWSIPTDLAESSNYKVKIKSTSNSSVNDYSDNSFTIEQGGGTGTVTDIDGNVYQTMVIGDQEWMIENLKVTHYRNGDPIPNVTDNDTWVGLSTGAYCYYNNSSANGDTYGALYNWYAVDDSRGLAPEGWHVPTDDEIKELEMFLGMSQSQADDTGWRGTNEGSKLAGGYDLWNNGNLRNDPEFDTSGFSFLPGGYRDYYRGHFYGMGGNGRFWSSTEYNSDIAWYRYLSCVYTTVNRYLGNKRGGFSVRCVRD